MTFHALAGELSLLYLRSAMLLRYLSVMETLHHAKFCARQAGTVLVAWLISLSAVLPSGSYCSDMRGGDPGRHCHAWRAAVVLTGPDPARACAGEPD